MKEKMRFYKVVCMCGHVGSMKSIPIPFVVKAMNGKEAAILARNIPRVKHHRKNAVLSCDEITKEQYEELNRINNADPYLSCKNIQEQREHSEIIKRAIKIKEEPKRIHKHKGEYSKKYSAWKREGRYKTVSIEEEENEFYYEMEDECFLGWAL